MSNLLEQVNIYMEGLRTLGKNAFFIKDGDNWTIEFGLSKKERAKHDGVYIKAREAKSYQTEFGIAMYVESKYYGNCDIEAPGRVGSQLNWTEKII